MYKFIVLLILFLFVLSGCHKQDEPNNQNSMESFSTSTDANHIHQYAKRYTAFLHKNSDMHLSDILVAVNLGLDQPNYENVVIWNDPASLTVFVNKHYGIPTGYRPDDLVKVDKRYAQSGVRLRRDCYEAFLAMAQDMEKENMELYIKSGYRVNSTHGGPDSLWYAWPGHSEHQTGLAFDLRKKGVSYRTLSEYKYEKTREYEWLTRNAYAYGFVLSYPKGKSDITGFGFEPWHWRYIGIEAATDMKQKGFETYQEYWASSLIQHAME